MINSSNLTSKIIIVGAGPVGCILAVILARSGFQVDIYESRPAPRHNSLSSTRTINITLSERALLVLSHLGLTDEVLEHAQEIYNKTIHTLTGEENAIQHKKHSKPLYAISRENLAKVLLSQVEQEKNITVHFEQRLTHVNFTSGCCSFSYMQAGKQAHKEIDADYIFAADGAFSKVRRLAQETPRFSYSQNYMQQCYIELTIAANADGTAKLATNTRHIWPRGGLLLTALPNNDASFTCTLYLNYEGEPSFASLTTPETVKQFFEQYFSDVLPLLENPIDDFLNKTANPLFLVSTSPWIINNKVALIGDAAHAMVPFYDQGLNCSLEDCHQIAKLISHFQGDLGKVLPAYYRQRKANADAISQLSQEYFNQISTDKDNKEKRLIKAIVHEFRKKEPDSWPSVDEIISFLPNISYANAQKISQQQNKITEELLKIPNIYQCWQDETVYLLLKKMVMEELSPLLQELNS